MDLKNQQLVSSLSREDLEDKYLQLRDENIVCVIYCFMWHNSELYFLNPSPNEEILFIFQRLKSATHKQEEKMKQ